MDKFSACSIKVYLIVKPRNECVIMLWVKLNISWEVFVCSPPDDGASCGLAASRSRRERKEKVGRKSALEQIKKAKRGEKVKYEVSLNSRLENEVRGRRHGTFEELPRKLSCKK